MTPPWKQYQEEACAFFLSLGLQATTDATVDGVRTKHDIDVLVRSIQVGFEITWLVECKKWKTPVTKLHVLALREIVSDLGADRGIILSEAGFQSGAFEAARLTNVRLSSLAALTSSAEHDIFALRLRELYDRVEVCNDEYWEISKRDRIDKGLRPEVGELSYSGARVIGECREILSLAFRGVYPIDAKSKMIGFGLTSYPIFNTAKDVFNVLNPMVSGLEDRLRQVTQLSSSPHASKHRI